MNPWIVPALRATSHWHVSVLMSRSKTVLGTQTTSVCGIPARCQKGRKVEFGQKPLATERALTKVLSLVICITDLHDIFTKK